MALRRQMPQAAGTTTPLGRRKKGGKMDVVREALGKGLGMFSDVAGFQAAQQLASGETKSDRMMECMMQQTMGAQVAWDPNANNGEGACVATGGPPAPPAPGVLGGQEPQ